MKPATTIIVGLVSALSVYFVWALHKRTKELMYAFVKAFFVLIVVALFVIAYGEIAGWDRLKEIALAIGHTIAIVLGSLVALILGLVVFFRAKEYLKERSLVAEECGPEDDLKSQ